MTWKVGQAVMCDRAGVQFVGYVIQANLNHLVIFCVDRKAVICGQQPHLERLGWTRTENGSVGDLLHHNGQDYSEQSCTVE